MHLIQTSIFICALSIPFLSMATGAAQDLKGLVGIFVGIIGQLALIIFALTFLVLIWGIVKGWIMHGGDVEAVENGKKVVFAGLVVFVVAGSLWGILAILKTTFFGN